MILALPDLGVVAHYTLQYQSTNADWEDYMGVPMTKQPHSFRPSTELQNFSAQQALWVIQGQPETKGGVCSTQRKETAQLNLPIFFLIFQNRLPSSQKPPAVEKTEC